MNTALQTFQFDGIPVSVVDQNGEGWMIGEDIGKALGYSEPRDSISKIYERNRDDLEDYSVTVKLTATDAKQYDTRVYNEEGVMMIGFLSKQPKAVAFRKWAVKVLKAYRHKELTAPDTSHLQAHLATQAQLIDSQAQLLAADRAAHAALIDQLTRFNTHLSQQNQRLNTAIAQHRLQQSYAYDMLNRAVRAQKPIEAAEIDEIVAKYRDGVAIANLSVLFYRSPAIIRRSIRQRGGL